MKKFAVTVAAVALFAGCARQDSGDMGATETTDSTATGSAATSQTGSSSTDTSVMDNSEMTSTNSPYGIQGTTPSTNDLQSPSPADPLSNTNALEQADEGSIQNPNIQPAPADPATPEQP